MDQPQLCESLEYAVDALTVTTRWEWPYGYRTQLSWRRSGGDSFSTCTIHSDDAEALVNEVAGRLASLLGVV